MCGPVHSVKDCRTTSEGLFSSRSLAWRYTRSPNKSFNERRTAKFVERAVVSSARRAVSSRRDVQTSV
eukprot:1816267-Amphidinium_carterae.1